MPDRKPPRAKRAKGKQGAPSNRANTGKHRPSTGLRSPKAPRYRS